MAHIFKKTTPEQKGIIVISHQEAYRAFESHGDIIQKIKDKGYFIGIHYGGLSLGALYPSFADFFMGRPSVTDIAVRCPHSFEIPVVSSNFTSTVFKKDPDVKKYWERYTKAERSTKYSLCAQKEMKRNFGLKTILWT